MEINEQIARRLRLLRDEAGLTIEALAARSGVSRAMISRIERAQSSPSAEVLNKLSLGFGLRLSQLLEFGSYAEPGLRRRNPVASRRSQAQWQDPVSGYLRRTLTPSTAEHPVQLCELRRCARATAWRWR